MSSRRAKRQRGHITSSSEEDETEHAATKKCVSSKTARTVAGRESTSKAQPLPSSPVRNSSLASREVAGSSATGRNVEPSKQRRAKPFTTTKTKALPIYSFFNTRSLAGTQKNPASTPATDDDSVDAIEDYDAHETCRSDPARTVAKVCDGRKKTTTADSTQSGPTPRNEVNSVASRKFLSKANTVEKSPATGVNKNNHLTRDDTWCTKYAPNNVEELAVNKKKVSDVRAWLNGALHGNIKKTLLILRGPSGSGKTATIKTLSSVLEFSLVEWHNPVGQEFRLEGSDSMSKQFDDFLERGMRYGGLRLNRKVEDQSEPSPSPNSNKIVLLDELPYTLVHSNNGLASFRASILRYLVAAVPEALESSSRNRHPSGPPLVIIVTESVTDFSMDPSDSFTAHRLLGPEIMNHFNTSVIDFNPIAPTILSKGLQLIIRKEARDSGRRRSLSMAVIKHLGESGDIRNAIASFEFLCCQTSKFSDASARNATSAVGPRSHKLGAWTDLENGIMNSLSQRSTSLDLFHAVAKVAHNKRHGPLRGHTTIGTVIGPPAHLNHHARPTVSEVDVDRLADETGADVSTFIAALHENYLLSCNGDSFIDTFSNCAERLSDVDMLSIDHSSFGASPYDRRTINSQASGTNSLRHWDVVFNVAVRGLLFELPSPVQRSISQHNGSLSKRDPYKMVYPTSMRLSKKRDDLMISIDHILGLLKQTEQAVSKSSGEISLSHRMKERSELTTLMLPYLVLIAERSEPTPLYITQLRDTISFTSPGTVTDGGNQEPSTNEGLKSSISSLSANAQQLILSDDDIED